MCLKQSNMRTPYIIFFAQYINRIEVDKSHHTDMLVVGVFSRNSTYIWQSQPFACVYVNKYKEL